MIDHDHQWAEEYYGWRCSICDMFIPFGCEPWMPTDEEIHNALLASLGAGEGARL